jgi:hypothetical protein
MIAPAAFEDITFPQQSLQYWSEYESNQWCRAGLSYFTSGSGNGAVYGTNTAMTAIGRAINHGILAENGKIYAAADAGSNIVTVIDTYTDTRTTITAGGNLASYSAFYSPITKMAYLPGFSAMRVINTTNDTSSGSVTYSAGGNYSFWWGVGFDGRYAYGSRWIGGSQFMRMDLFNGTITNTAVTSYVGDPQNGTMGVNGKIYFGGGGGTTSGIHCYNPFTDTMEYVAVPGQSDVSDFYRDVVQHPNGFLYCFPAYGSDTIVRIDPRTNTATIALSGVTDTRANNYAIGADGLIYTVGNTDQMVIYNPFTNTVSYETLPSGDWQTIIMSPSGDLHMFSTAGSYRVKRLLNNGRVIRPLQELNGIISRLTGA